jgi:hypothetical protein
VLVLQRSVIPDLYCSLLVVLTNPPVCCLLALVLERDILVVTFLWLVVQSLTQGAFVCVSGAESGSCSVPIVLEQFQLLWATAL